MSAPAVTRIASFLALAPGEQPVKEYYVASTDTRRFPPGLTITALVLLVAGVVLARHPAGCIPGVVMLLWMALRGLDIHHAQVMVSTHRLVYFEYSDHPATNIYFVQDVDLGEVTALAASARRTLLTRSFTFHVWTERQLAISLGAFAGASVGKLLEHAGQKLLEPKGDYVAFIQEIGALVSQLQAAARADAGGTSSPRPQLG